MAIDDLARELVGVGLRRWARRRPRRWRARRGRRRRRRGWCRARGRRPARPTAPAARRRRSAARSRSRDPTTTSWPAAASRAAMPRPAGPVPPNTPIFIAQSFAHPRPRSPPARPLPEHPAERVRMRHRSDGWSRRRLVVVPPRHRASHAERPHRTHRTPPARPRHQPPGTRRRLRATARATASETGSSNPLRRGVYRVAGAPTPGSSHSWPPVSRRPERLASFRSAAALLGPRRLPARRRRDHGAGIATGVGSRASSSTRARSSGPLHLGIVDGIPVASAARTLCDLTAVVRPWTVERAVDEALRRRIVDLGTLTRVADDARGPRAIAAAP